MFKQDPNQNTIILRTTREPNHFTHPNNLLKTVAKQIFPFNAVTNNNFRPVFGSRCAD